MVYPYLVLHDGVYYPAGTDVPVGNKPTESKAEKEKDLQPINSEDVIEQVKNTSNVFTLRKIAREHDIPFESDVKMAELKALLLDRLK